MTGDTDRYAADHLRERLEADLAWHAAGEPLRLLRAHFGLVSGLRDSVDLLPRAAEDDWRNIAARLAAIPEMLRSWRSAAAAHEGYAQTARYLREGYAPRAAETDGVGAERYAVAARQNLGADLDLVDPYQWGWDELQRVEAELAAEADRVRAGAGVDEAIAVLNRTEYVVGADAYRAWLQDRHDEAIAALHGTHFRAAQAICYKLGERAWLAACDEARQRPGFDLRRWHTAALDLGPVGLAGLDDALRRIH